MSSVASRPTPTAISAGTEETARLFAEHSEQIFGYCLRHLPSRPEAEDAVQTTFLYALRALRRGVVPECESAWLTAIAKNVCRWQRRTLDRRGPLASDVDLDRVGLAQPDGDEDVILSDLKDALASLPERQRRALLLREWQGLPSREIATSLEMTPTATHALLTRARKSLANALTTPRPVLGLGTLLYQYRFQLKALLGGAGVKAATATLVVGAVAGGAVVERALDDRSSAPRARANPPSIARAESPTPAFASPQHKTASRNALGPQRSAIPMGGQATATSRSSSSADERATVRTVRPPVSAPTVRPPVDDVGDGSSVMPVAAPGAEQAPAPAPDLSVDVPPAPEVEIPENLVPLDLPPPVPSVPALPTGELSLPPAPASLPPL